MKLHGNARTCPKSRRLLVERLEGEWSLTEAAEAAGVSERTAAKWLARWRAEGYANEFLATFLSGRVLKGADRLSTVDKFVLGPRLAGLESAIEYGREPGPALVELFKTRNELVHTSPQPGVYAVEMDKGETRPYEPQCAARYLIQVAHAAVSGKCD